MKKTLLVSLMALVFAASPVTKSQCYAAQPQSYTVYGRSGETSTYTEQTKWYYRTVDGKLQKRLWSITQEKWLTDWMWA